MKPWAHWAAFASSVCAGNAKRTRPASRFFIFFVRNCEFLGAVLDPAGSQGGSKNHVFGYHVGKMTKKGCPKTRTEKTSKFDRKFVPQ